jgi:MoaA/NifB/PqqE/SkfB family radical SAM enzyme
MIRQVLDHYRKLRENDAFGLLLQPRVLANYRLYQQEVAARPLVMTSLPPGMEIELTNRCNLACVQCLRSRGLRPYALGDMELGHYQTILAQFPFVTNLNLNGFGEALMHPRFFDIVAYTRRVRPWCKIGIYSNGMLIDDQRAHQLTGCGVTEVNVSIDAARPETYRRVRRGGQLEVVHDNIRRLMHARRSTGARFPLVGVNFVMLNENEGELVPFVEQAADLGVDFINCITYASYDWGFQNTRTADNYRHELAAAARRIADLGIRCKSFPSDDLSWTDKNRPFDCAFFWGSSLRITYAGDVTLGCCSPFRETYSYGNVLERPFSQIWNGELYRRNRALARQSTPPCATCQSCDAFGKSFFDEHDGIWRLRPVG